MRVRGTSPDGAHPGLCLKPALAECLHPTALTDTTVDKFVETTQTTNKTHLLASNYGTFQSLVVCKNIVPQNGTSTQLINAPSCVKMGVSTIGARELSYISSYQTLSADKKWKSY